MKPLNPDKSPSPALRMFLVFCGITLSSFTAAMPASGEIVPNPKTTVILRHLANLPHDLVDGEKARFSNLGERQAEAEGKKWMDERLAELDKSVGGDRPEFIRQLFHFSALSSTNMEQALVAGMVIKHAKVPADQIASAMLPLLESADGKVRKEAAQWLADTDWAPGEEGVDFLRYESILLKSNPAIPLGLVRYLFNRAPRTALQTVVRVYGGEVADAELRSRLARLDPNVFRASAKEDLEYFVARPEWWAQLFVASALADDPELYGWDFRNQMVARLEKSDHPLVREKVADLKARFSPR